MTGLLRAVVSARPREKAGAQTMARYGFQVHVSILKMLELHHAGSDYRAAFDHFDDLMVFDKADQPEKVAFFQIKSQANGTWTLKQMTSKKGNGSPPVTFLGRLHHHMAAFGHTVSHLGFVSNLSFRLKLADGTETTDDHHVILSTQLHADELVALKAAVANDVVGPPPAVDGAHLFVFERTALGLMDQASLVRGRLLSFFHEREGADHIPVMSLYETLRGSVFPRSTVTQQFMTTEEFYDRKTLCRADIEAMFCRATAGRRFHESWESIRQDLVAVGMTGLEIIRLRISCTRYIKARSVGESGAAAFSVAARSATLINRTEVGACASLPEIATLIGNCVPSDYEHRHGALYVEAFEALT